jgi:glycerol uptake operon antiterminator
MKKRPHRRSILAWLRRPFIPVFWEIPRDATALERASVIFLQGGELTELPKVLEWLAGSPLAGVPVVLHIDLVAGLSNDEAGLRYVASLDGISGIITVRHHLVSPARRLGLACIVRLFLHDTRAVDRGLQIVESAQPDAIELLPGVAAIEVADRFRGIDLPRIAGGLVRTPQLAQRVLQSGYQAISTSDPNLWRLNRLEPSEWGHGASQS